MFPCPQGPKFEGLNVVSWDVKTTIDAQKPDLITAPEYDKDSYSDPGHVLVGGDEILGSAVLTCQAWQQTVDNVRSALPETTLRSVGVPFEHRPLFGTSTAIAALQFEIDSGYRRRSLFVFRPVVVTHPWNHY